MATNEVILERFEYGIQSMLSERRLTSVAASYDILHSVELNALAIYVTFTVPGQRLAEYRYPRDWWQAARARFSPRWMLRKWPVAETVVEARALYPMLAIPDTDDAWATIKFERIV